MVKALFVRWVVAPLITLTVGSSLGLAANNFDIVAGCIAKNKGDFDAAKACAERSQAHSPPRIPASNAHAIVNSSPDQGPPSMPSASAADTVTEHWRLNKQVDGEVEEFKHLFVSPGDGYMFCGYQPMQTVNHKSTWTVLNPNNQNVSVFTYVGEWLIFDMDVRWLSKESAGRSPENIKCEGDGWRMLPSQDNRLRFRTKSSCALFVMVCYGEDEYGKRGDSEVCGVCAGTMFKF